MMQCSQCGSEDTQRLEMAYQAGTNDIQTTSHTTGVGYARGSFGIGGAKTKTSGTSSSKLAQQAAPPAKKNIVGAFVIMFVGLMLMWIFGVKNIMFFLGLLILAFGAWVGYKNFTFNSKVWPDLYANWRKQWICLRCGNVFTPADTSAE